jgi:hypothetical protein
VMVGDEPTVVVIGTLTPGEAHGQGESYLEINERLAINQHQLNVTEGNRYANLNARYGRFTIDMPYESLQQGFDLSLPYWFKLTISEDNLTERELPTAFDEQRGLIMAMGINYDYQPTGLIRTVSLEWEMETSGRPGVEITLYLDVP